MQEQITVGTIINAPIQKIWECWINPEHITKWCQASDDWHAPQATNDVRVDGKFMTRMEAKDGSEGFDFEGTYTLVQPQQRIEYVMSDGRQVTIEFITEADGCRVIETFDPETENPIEMQRAGWQAILNNFKKYVENL